MTKSELIERLAGETSITKAKARDVLDALTYIVVVKVSSGEKVQITDLGTFDLGSRAARRGVDPQTMAEIQIPMMAVPRFRAGKFFKQMVRKVDYVKKSVRK